MSPYLRSIDIEFLAQNASMLLACGVKLADDGKDLGGGLYVVNTDMRSEAQAFIESDPNDGKGVEICATDSKRTFLNTAVLHSEVKEAGTSFKPPPGSTQRTLPRFGAPNMLSNGQLNPPKHKARAFAAADRQQSEGRRTTFREIKARINSIGIPLVSLLLSDLMRTLAEVVGYITLPWWIVRIVRAHDTRRLLRQSAKVTTCSTCSTTIRPTSVRSFIPPIRTTPTR
ncbi:MAG TPA: YciI family protein [Paraburkholderia sp.]